MAFERARTQLALGMRRRRSRRRADARAVLREALAYFERSGAEPWARQAQAELRATGEMPPRDNAGGLRPLTPQELQVALTVAQGATNREAAAALFLSPKTVEFHLGNTYRKLGVRSRAELVRRVEGLT
jgi:DNA-binding CsgD family transcriptional regulator